MGVNLPARPLDRRSLIRPQQARSFFLQLNSRRKLRAAKGHGELLLTEQIVGLAIEVHRRTDPGRPGPAYAACTSSEPVQGRIPTLRPIFMPVRDA